jgi:hypothetical protein
MSGKIQQQLYTRERGGVFSTTDGFDTIAISEQLDKSFVKKYLHPFCLYDSPKSFTAIGQKDATLYPKAITIFQPETGDMVIGQTVFVPTDFTGQRSAYFMHNYVIPSNLKEGWIKDSTKVFQISDFETSYEFGLGKVLPEKEEVQHGCLDILSVKDDLLEKLGITELDFKQLLFSVMTSIAGKKKVFISLNVPLQDYTQYAMQLLEMLYLYLPYAHRRRLGAITFSSSPETKNYIHVVFFEPGTLNYSDRSIEKQFIFDFASGRISGVNIEGNTQGYLDFALEKFRKSERLDAFFAFAEESLWGLSEDKSLELLSYHELTNLFLSLSGSNHAIYSKNKVGFLLGLLKFLQVNHHEKLEMVELFVKLLQVEKVADEPDHVLDYINAVLAVNKTVQRNEPIFFILETLKHYQNHNLFIQLWQLLEQDKPSYEGILHLVLAHQEYEPLLECYFKERFKPLTHVEDILLELKSMLDTAFLLTSQKFILVVIAKVESAVILKSNAFKAVQAIKDFKLDREDIEFLDFKQKLVDRSERAILSHIRPNELTTEDIENFSKIFPNPMNVKFMKDEKARENFQIVQALYQLLNMSEQASPDVLKGLSKVQREQVRDILRQQLRHKVSIDHLSLLHTAYETGDGEVDYGLLLKHLIQYSDGYTLLAFIKKYQSLIGIDVTYRDLLFSYFVSNSGSIWRDKTYRKELKSIRNRTFNHFLKEVELETEKNPIIKFLKKKGLKQWHI